MKSCPENEDGRPAMDDHPTNPDTTYSTRSAPDPLRRIPAQRGVDQAVQGTDPWWGSCARAAIRHLASTGRTFSADDLRFDCDLGEPEHPNWWGGAFASARKAGLITMVGYTLSRRPERGSAILRTWRGVQR